MWSSGVINYMESVNELTSVPWGDFMLRCSIWLYAPINSFRLWYQKLSSLYPLYEMSTFHVHGAVVDIMQLIGLYL